MLLDLAWAFTFSTILETGFRSHSFCNLEKHSFLHGNLETVLGSVTAIEQMGTWEMWIVVFKTCLGKTEEIIRVENGEFEEWNL